MVVPTNRISSILRSLDESREVEPPECSAREVHFEVISVTSYYDAFDRVTETAESSGEYVFGYTGRELDAETGLMFHRARYYDPTVGRFMSEDPIGFQAEDADLYRYVKNSSPNYIDWNGNTIVSAAKVEDIFERSMSKAKGVFSKNKFWKETPKGSVYEYGSLLRISPVDRLAIFANEKDDPTFEIIYQMLASPRIFRIKGKTATEVETNFNKHIAARVKTVYFAKQSLFSWPGDPGAPSKDHLDEVWTNPWLGNPNVERERYFVGDADEAFRILYERNKESRPCYCSQAQRFTALIGTWSSLSDEEKKSIFNKAFNKKGQNTGNIDVGFAGLHRQEWQSDAIDWIPGDLSFLPNQQWDGKDMGHAGENIIYVGAGLFYGHVPKDDSTSDQYELHSLGYWIQRVHRWSNKTEWTREELNKAIELANKLPDQGGPPARFQPITVNNPNGRGLIPNPAIFKWVIPRERWFTKIGLKE